MRLTWPESGGLLTPDEYEARQPSILARSSAPLNWPGIRVVDAPATPALECEVPPLSHLLLALHGPTVPRRVVLRSEGLRYEAEHGSPSSVGILPPGLGCEHRCGNTVEWTTTLISPGFVAKVAAEACGLDPGRLALRPLFYDPWPALVAPLAALRDELRDGGMGGRLYVESLANVLVIQVIRRLADRPMPRGTTGRLAGPALRAVIEYVMDNLGTDLALADLAAVAHLSEFHFARTFKATTGQSPHQFVVTQRIERAKQLIGERRLSLAQVAAAVGFTDQSHFTRQFKRLVGVTPRHFG